jgi:ABC-2 type transport system ATP-binding protein
MTALAVTDLSHAFDGKSVLKDVSFEVETGSFTVLLGRNGAGKTTLISIATGLYSCQSGKVRILGHDLRTTPLLALSRLGVVFQSPTLDLDLSIIENLIYHAALHDLSRREARERALGAIERLGLKARARDKVRVLSGGMRRRIEIARALLHKPALLIVDEATAGLDVAARQNLLCSVRDLCRANELSVLWATHMLDEVEASDPVIVLHDGCILARGMTADLARSGENLSDAFLRLTGASA